MLQPHDLVAQLANGGALPLDETKLGLQSGAVSPDEARHPQGMSQAVGEPVSVQGKGVKIMKTGCQQIAKGFAGETVPLDEADPQGAGVLRYQVVEGFVLLMLDHHQHQGIVLFLQFFLCHHQGACLLHLPLALFQQAFQYGT